MALCDEMRLLLGPFDDGELEPHEMEEVAFHVVGCVGCKSALDDYRSLGVALRDVVTVPALDHFAAEVAVRIDHTWVPLHARLRRLRDAVGHLGSVFEIVAVAAATAVVTLMVVTPYARQFLTVATPAPVSESVARAIAPPLVIPKANAAHDAAQGIAGGSGAADVAAYDVATTDDAAIRASQAEVLSRFGAGESPSVAVWSEPHSGTTVVWVPDQR